MIEDRQGFVPEEEEGLANGCDAEVVTRGVRAPDAAAHGGDARPSCRRHQRGAAGTTTPMDHWVDEVEATISLGVRELACRLNGDGKNFDKAAANLARTAQVRVSGETLRVLVETEGRRVLAAQRTDQLPVGWSA